jgi:hypothetical protein
MGKNAGLSPAFLFHIHSLAPACKLQISGAGYGQLLA